MRSITFKLIVPILALLLGCAFQGVKAQTPNPKQEYVLAKSDVPSLQPGEKQCNYFFWSKLGTSDQRVSFSYLKSSGSTDGDDPKINGYITIVIDETKTVPTAQKTGFDEAANAYWTVRMNQATYASEQSCLEGVKVKK